MLKNWTVITQATKNVMAREHYLTNMKHRNHTGTERIINLYGSETQSLNILHNCERYKLKQAANKRGGRPPTPSIEVCFTLPKNIRPSQAQWRQILNMLMIKLAPHLGVSTKQLSTIVRAVIHQQNQEVNQKGSGDHMHVVLGKFTDDLTYLAELQRKSTTRLLKLAFNNAVYKTTGISHQSYQLQKSYRGTAKNRAPSWQVKAARKQEEIASQEQQLKRMINQAQRWLCAFDDNDKKQMNRQYNRLIKELDTLGKSNAETQALYELMQQLIHKVEIKRQLQCRQREPLPRRISATNVAN